MQSQAKLKVTVAPSVWNRLMFWAHNAKGLEVSGMGLLAPSALSKGIINVRDIVMLSQENSSSYTEMDDAAMSKFYSENFDAGKKIGEFGCVWLHTHPGECCQPSGTDEDTFKKTFGRHPWALMLILGKSGKMYGRIKSNFPRIEQEVEVVVDWTDWESQIDTDKWSELYDANVREKTYELAATQIGFHGEHQSHKNWIDYATFEECDTGMGSREEYYKWYKKANKIGSSKDCTSELLKMRSHLIGQMEHGTMYESEVMYLLWLNWLLNKKNVKHEYPEQWSLFVQQEGIAIHYGKKGPYMKTDNVVHKGEATNTKETAFGYGINEDTPEDKPPVSNDGMAGLPCPEDIIVDAVAYGERIESGGEVFFNYEGSLYHPKLKRVMLFEEATTIMSSANFIEPPECCPVQGGVS